MDERKCDACKQWFKMIELIRLPAAGNNRTDFLCFDCYRKRMLGEDRKI